ncbi:MAG: hypothetical protein KH757_11580 [Megasphaera sp.]|nr:hypothetical protein [Megasphaera sp.]
MHRSDVILTVGEPLRTLLTAERTMLSLVSHCPGSRISPPRWVTPARPFQCCECCSSTRCVVAGRHSPGGAERRHTHQGQSHRLGEIGTSAGPGVRPAQPRTANLSENVASGAW